MTGYEKNGLADKLAIRRAKILFHAENLRLHHAMRIAGNCGLIGQKTLSLIDRQVSPPAITSGKITSSPVFLSNPFFALRLSAVPGCFSGFACVA